MSAAAILNPTPASLPPSLYTPRAAKCSPSQIQEMRVLAEIFLGIFLQMSPDQRKTYLADSACAAQPLSIHSACEEERHLA